MLDLAGYDMPKVLGFGSRFGMRRIICLMMLCPSAASVVAIKATREEDEMA